MLSQPGNLSPSWRPPNPRIMYICMGDDVPFDLVSPSHMWMSFHTQLTPNGRSYWLSLAFRLLGSSDSLNNRNERHSGAEHHVPIWCRAPSCWTISAAEHEPFDQRRVDHLGRRAEVYTLWTSVVSSRVTHQTGSGIKILTTYSEYTFCVGYLYSGVGGDNNTMYIWHKLVCV